MNLPWAEDPLWRALRALRPSPARLALAAVTGSLALGCAVGLMATSAWLISRAAQRPPILELSVAVVATRAFGIGRGVLRYTERLLSHDVALRGVVALRERLYRCLVDADPALVAGLRRGDLLARVGADVDALADVVVRSLLPAAVAALTGTVTVVLLTVALPPAGLVLACGLLVAGVVAPLLAARGARAAERHASQVTAEISAEALALFDGLAEWSVAGVLPARLERAAALESRRDGAMDRAAVPTAAATAWGTLAVGAATLGCLVLGVRAVVAGDLSPVMLAVVALTPVAAGEVVLPLTAAAVGIVRARAAAVRVVHLLESTASPRPTLPPSDPDPHPAGTAPHVRATGLACGWPGNPPTLTGVDLDLPPGRRVAVVGPSGTGKTTLLLTLAGLLRPLAGRVTVAPSTGRAPSGTGQRTIAPAPPGAIDLCDLPGPHRARLVAFTAEDAHVFATTLRENLRVARPDASDADLLAAVERAGLGPWCRALSEGLDTPLASDAADVSGGERRRLLLARAWLTGAPVVLLDEPGEHLAPEVADALLLGFLAPQPLGGAAGRGADDPGPPAADPLTGGARVVVTHRLGPLVAADEILWVENGTITHRGVHDHLLRTCPGYRDSWQAERGASCDGVDAPA